MLKPDANVEGITPLIILLVSDSVPLNVAIVPLVGRVMFVLSVDVMVVVKLPAVVKLPDVVKAPPKIIGLPPILFTKGDAADPPKSPANCSLPFVVTSASGVDKVPTSEETKAVVAICVLLVPVTAVGAVGVPVKDGDAIVARNNMLEVFVLILFDNATVSLPILELNIADVSEILTLLLILLDKEAVSLVKRLLNIADVSEYFMPESV